MAEVLERQFTRITANIGGPSSPIRYDRYDGRDYIVAPMAMLAEGVLQGTSSDGEEIPIFYPDEEVGRNPASWNHKPMVVGHPTVNGKPVAACDPATLEKQGVGLIFNSMKDDKLRAEAWIDPIKAKLIEPRILECLDNGIPMEISTGLFTMNTVTAGKYGEKDYSAVARNYQPDHVAILPDAIGAYSIEDGGGLLQINESTRIEHVEFMHNRKWTEAERHALPEADFGDPKKKLYPIKYQADVNSAKHLIGKAGDPDAVKKRIIEIAKRKGLSIPAEWHGHGMTTNEMSSLGSGSDNSVNSSQNSNNIIRMSHSNLRRALGDKLRSSKSTDSSKTGTSSTPSDLYEGYSYVEDTYDDFFVYSDGNGKLFKQGYTTDGTDVSFKGSASPVKRVTEYRDAVSNSYVGNSYTQISLREFEKMTVKNDAGNTAVVTPAAPTGDAPAINAAGGQTQQANEAPTTNSTTTENTGQTLTDGKGAVPGILKPSSAPATTVVSRDTMANELINGGGWNNTDKSWLMGLEESKFETIYKLSKGGTVAGAVAAGGRATKSGDTYTTEGPGVGNNPGPATNQQTQGDTTLTTPNTGGSILNNNTPPVQPVATGYQITPEDVQLLANLRSKSREEREFLIVNIAKHPKCSFTEAYLREVDPQGVPKRSQDELVGLARMLDLPTSQGQLLANANGAYGAMGLGAFTPNGALQANQAQIDELMNPKEAPLGTPFVANESPEAKKARRERLANGGPLLERNQARTGK